MINVTKMNFRNETTEFDFDEVVETAPTPVITPRRTPG